MKLLALLLALAMADPDELVEVSGSVLDNAGHAVPRVGVYAVDPRGSHVDAYTRSDQDGLFRLRVPRRTHDFAVMSPGWMLARFQRVDDRHVRITVRAAFPQEPAEIAKQAKGWLPVLAQPRGSAPNAHGVVTYGPSVGLIEGHVADETGMRLPGVRILSVAGEGNGLFNVTETDAQGRFSLVTAAGHNRLVVWSPGLKLGKARHAPDGRLEITMAIDAGTETIRTYQGHVLTFSMEDSIWPEILPPPPVRGFLRLNYGIDIDDNFCPGDLVHTGVGWHGGLATFGVSCRNARTCPASAWQHQCKVPKYWWLRVLESEPPNPARMRRRWWEGIMRDLQAAEAAAEAAPKPAPP